MRRLYAHGLDGIKRERRVSARKNARTVLGPFSLESFRVAFVPVPFHRQSTVRAHLTDAAIRRLSTAQPYLDVWDRGWRKPGSFGLRVYPSGVKVWRYLEFVPVFEDARQVGTKKKLHTLGDWPDLSLEGAITKATKIARLRHVGAGRTVEELAQRAFAKLRSSGSAARTLATHNSAANRHVLPYIGQKRDYEVTTPMLQDLVDRVQLAGHMGLARSVQSVLRLIFEDSTALGLEYNPALSVRVAKHDRVRRLPTTDTKALLELLSRVWRAAEQLEAESWEWQRFALALRFQIATLQRTEATLSLYRPHVQGDWWIHPGSFTVKGRESEYRTKRGQETAVALVGLGRQTLDRALELSDNAFPFGVGPHRLARRGYPYTFTAAVREAAKIPDEQWRPHDSRKIGATVLDRLGVPLDHYQRVLSHTRPRSTTSTFYVLPELRDPVLAAVLEKWSDHLRQHLSGGAAARSGSSLAR